MIFPEEASSTKPLWEKLGIRPRNGIDLPLFALRTEESLGIGEFLDLIPLIDWVSSLKMDFIKLLPLNDTLEDPSPYNAISSCALHPLYLSLRKLPFLEEFPELKRRLDTDFSDLNQTERVAYTEVRRRKAAWLLDYVAHIKDWLIPSQNFIHFIATYPWVENYALFKTLKVFFKNTSWDLWPQEIKSPTPELIETLLKQFSTEVIFHIVLQFFCFEQLKAVKEYASSRKILLMGDIPFLINRDSADVWLHPHLFDLTLSAGSPPDTFNSEGQCWGTPLYMWDVIKKEGYQWWKERLAYASHFYDLYRIDHIVGFFRVWAIPPHVPCIQGGFVPTDPSTWIEQGKEILEALLSSSSMLPIGEDLGIVPKEVKDTLTNLGICGTKVIRWQRKYHEGENPFIPFADYPPLGLCSVSTHDSDTLELWWKKYPEEAQDFASFEGWEYSPTLTFTQRMTILWQSHHNPCLFHANLLHEYLALFPELVSEDPENERINKPGEILPTNWTYRFRPSLEEMRQHAPLQEAFAKILFSPSIDTCI